MITTKNMKSFFLASGIILLLHACHSTKGVVTPQPVFEKLKNADWLLGRWENNSPRGNLSETWKQSSDSTYTGHTFFIRGVDTLFRESITILQDREDLFYIVTVSGQNNDQPVPFKMSLSSETSLTFENPEHDFPKVIEYQLIRNDSLVAVVSGNGKSQRFTFSRKK